MRSKVGMVGMGALALSIVRCSSFSGGDDEPASDGGLEGSPAGLDASVDGDAAKDCAASLSTDPKNCGRCGHDCLSGDCIEGVCQPFVLASNLTGPGELALGDTRVYWETTVGLVRNVVYCPRAGCGLGPELLLADLDDVLSLLVAGERLFFGTKNFTAGRSAIETCDPSSREMCLASRRPLDGAMWTFPFTPLRRGPGAAYWGAPVQPTGEIRRVALGDGAQPASISDAGCIPARVAVTATAAAWTCLNGSTIRGCSFPCNDGGTELTQAGGDTGQLELAPSYVVWETVTPTPRLRIRDTGTAGVRDLPGRGTGPLTLVGDDLIFYDSLLDRIDVCRLPDCATTIKVAKGPAATLVADERAVFWTIPAQGVVMSVAR